MTKKYDCAVIGNWHLAFVTAGVLSSMNYKVILVNHDPDQKWTQFPEIPVHEPGLKEIFTDARAKGNLDFAQSVSDNWSSDYIWMAIDTPVNENDEANTEPLMKTAQILSNLKLKPEVFILSSQIPIGFCTQIQQEFKLPVAYVPENLRLGKGIETFLRADRTVIGASSSELAAKVARFMASFSTEFLICNLETAEMVKHANNAFLAMSISFANELARLGEVFQVDGQIVAKALKMDKRIGPGAYVSPGLGFAGGTLPRDIRVLQEIGHTYKIPTRIMDAVINVNEDTTLSICEMVEKSLKESSTITKGHVLILGYTYKADTDTLRRSLSVDIARFLHKKGYRVNGFDPMMNSKDLSSFEDCLIHWDEIDQIKEKPEVVLLMTARPAFKAINWKKLAAQWNLNSSNRTLVLDTQSCLDKEPLMQSQFDFKKLWSPLERSHA